MHTKEDFYVIGVGLPRTATLSMKTALEMVLPGKCTHMDDTLNSPHEWTRICDEEMDDDEFKDFLLSNGFTSGVDAPFIFYYERLMKIFPNAKVILTIRDPTKWTVSVRTTICASHKYVETFPAILDHWFRPITKYLKHNTIMAWNVKKIKEFREMLKLCSDGRGEEFFKQWTERIKATVPPEKLPIFNVADGWEPLCSFLDVPIPREPFPRVNDTKKYLEKVEKMKYEGWKAVIQIIVLLVAACISWLLFF